MTFLNPDEPLERQNERLIRITEALMRKVEQKTDEAGLAYAQFERAALLEAQVKERTRDLERTLDLLQDSNARLASANAEAQAARSNLSEAIETVREGFALFDAEDHLVLANSRFCRDFLDIGDEIAPGLSFDEYVRLVSSSRFLALPEDETPDSWASARLSRHRDRSAEFNVSLIFDRWLKVSEHRTATGGTVILQTDITEIMRAERQERDRLRDRQARMVRATLDHLNQGVCIFDGGGNLVGWNRRMDTLLGLPLDEPVLGAPFGALLDGLSDRITFSDGFTADGLLSWAARGSGRQPLALEVRREPDRILSIFAQEMPDRGFVISFTDVTAEREAANALFEMNELLERRVEERTLELGDALAEAERANASKSRFVAAASHDLLQPLSAAKLFVSTLADRAEETETLDIIGKAETALTSVENIIDALLNISRLDSGKAAFEIRPTPLSAILQPLRNELGPVAAAKGLDLRVIDSGLTVESDPGYLRRIVQNLMSNAIRYTEKGRVTVGVRRVGRSARIEVWDTGPGIPDAEQKTVFQEFKRLGNQTAGPGGLGLGLAIVERACESLGHPLSLWSEEGVGSCFSVAVPVHTATSAPSGKTSATLIEGASCEGLVVLLVENDEPFARAASLMIESWGALVLHVADGEGALDLLREIDLTPDVLLLDYQLGARMNGIALFDAICDQYGRLPARIVSADRSRDLRKLCAARGLELLTKPVDRDRLLTFLQSINVG
ncbi:PAS-domain containing protein [Aestuariibius sp. 2305UL40-4]|uniref:hybrid sensor histidine kinase/response regulator n=1 Tax=Aestuariibius violaceus TaxID=3234132 RepID=UPI00345E8899